MMWHLFCQRITAASAAPHSRTHFRECVLIFRPYRSGSFLKKATVLAGGGNNASHPRHPVKNSLRPLVLGHVLCQYLGENAVSKGVKLFFGSNTRSVYGVVVRTDVRTSIYIEPTLVARDTWFCAGQVTVPILPPFMRCGFTERRFCKKGELL
ncbi:MAG: hypothetical protein GX303_02585 [Clostridiales bacterium]|nr:hypothetical protein [Clostridiales bacterium]